VGFYINNSSSADRKLHREPESTVNLCTFRFFFFLVFGLLIKELPLPTFLSLLYSGMKLVSSTCVRSSAEVRRDKDKGDVKRHLPLSFPSIELEQYGGAKTIILMIDRA
jgi:hypothetical protein